MKNKYLSDLYIIELSLLYIPYKFLNINDKINYKKTI